MWFYRTILRISLTECVINEKALQKMAAKKNVYTLNQAETVGKPCTHNEKGDS